MNEHEAQNLIMDYLYAELEPEQEAEFTLHLQECQKCRDEVKTLRALIDSYRKLPAAQPPANAAAVALVRVRDRKMKSTPLPAASGPVPSALAEQPLSGSAHETPELATVTEGTDGVDNVVPLSRRFVFHPAWGLAAVLVLVFTVLIAMPDLEKDMKQGFTPEGNLRTKKSAAKAPETEEAEEIKTDEEIRTAKDMPESKLQKIKPQKRVDQNKPVLELLDKDKRADKKDRALLVKPPALREIRKGVSHPVEHGSESAYQCKARRAKTTVIRKSGRVAANKKIMSVKKRKSDKPNTPARPVSDFKPGHTGGGAGFAQPRKQEYCKPVSQAWTKAAAGADKAIISRNNAKALGSRKILRAKKRKAQSVSAPAAPRAVSAKAESTRQQGAQPLVKRDIETETDWAGDTVADDGLKFGNTRSGKIGAIGAKAKKQNALPMRKKSRAGNLATVHAQANRAVRDAGPSTLKEKKRTDRKTDKVVVEGSRSKVDLLQQARRAFTRHDYSRALELVNRICKPERTECTNTAAQSIAVLTLKVRCEMELRRLTAAAITIKKLRKQDPTTAAALSRELQALQSAPIKSRKPTPAAHPRPACKFSTDAYDE